MWYAVLPNFSPLYLPLRNLAIKPLTVDCREIENENNALEQTWRSYGSLAKEMDRLLNGLSIDGELENVLRDPLGTLGISDGRGKIQIDQVRRMPNHPGKPPDDVTFLITRPLIADRQRRH